MKKEFIRAPFSKFRYIYNKKTTMSKIVKKKQLDVLIENTLKEAGIETKKVIEEPKKVVKESVKESVKEEPKKEVLSEDFKRELEKFNKLTSFNYKY